MNKDFFDEFSDIRDRMLKNIQLDKNSWNKFLIYWSKILDKYSVDNVLNLYTYNPTGKIFMTFDEWNSNKIDRRIKPKSKGIPIFDNNFKIYVFDIKQEYEYNGKIKYNKISVMLSNELINDILNMSKNDTISIKGKLHSYVDKDNNPKTVINCTDIDILEISKNQNEKTK